MPPHGAGAGVGLSPPAARQALLLRDELVYPRLLRLLRLARGLGLLPRLLRLPRAELPLQLLLAAQDVLDDHLLVVQYAVVSDHRVDARLQGEAARVDLLHGIAVQGT